MIKYILFLLAVVFSVCANSASFDCSLKLNKVEKMVCDFPEVSLLDEQLAKAYQHKKTIAENADKLRAGQRTWLNKVRNSCHNKQCLVEAYQLRIADLQGPAFSGKKIKLKEPSFRISDGLGKPLCETYLNVINSLPIDELKACQLPPLSGTGITPVDFSPLTGAKLAKFDRIVYEQQGGSGPWDDWETQWPTRKKEYESGYRILSEAFWDLDKDGSVDHIVRKSQPSPSCELLEVGKASAMRASKRQLWQSKPIPEQVEIAQSAGYKHYYSLIDGDTLSFVHADHFVEFGGEVISIDQDRVVLQKTTNNWANREWIYIWEIDPVRSVKHRRYREFPAICKFEYLNN